MRLENKQPGDKIQGFSGFAAAWASTQPPQFSRHCASGTSAPSLRASPCIPCPKPLLTDSPLSQSCVFSCTPAPRWWWSCPCICTPQDLRRTGKYTQVGLGLWDLDFQRSLPAGSRAPKMLIRKVWRWLRQTQVLWLLVVPAYVSVLWLSKLPDWTGTSSHQLLLKI